MGITNWLMHRGMRRIAKKWVLWATESYQSLHAQYPNISDREIFKIALSQKIKFQNGEKDCDLILDRYGSSIYGLCYFLGLGCKSMKNSMIFRCVQFTEYVDYELEKRGFQKPSNDIKRGYFKLLDLPEDAVDEKYL